MQGRKHKLPFPLEIDETRLSGFLLSGRDPERIFDSRINEPCRHQPCPYALLGMRVRDSPEDVCAAFRQKSKLGAEEICKFGLIVYHVELSVRTAVPLERQKELLDGLANGPAEGPAWSQVRGHIDHDGLEAIHFPRRNGMAILVLFQRAREFVQITEASPYIPG